MKGLVILDVILVLFIVGGSLNGLRIGALRQLASLVTFYISIILTTRFYRSLLPHVERLLSGAPGAVLDGVLFSIILLLLYAVLSIIFFGVVWTNRPFRARRGFNWRKPPDLTGQSVVSIVNHLGGLVIGFVTICCWIAIGLLVLNFMLGSFWFEWEDYRRRLAIQYDLSSLVPVFRRFLPYVIRTINPWFPEGLPTLFLRL